MKRMNIRQIQFKHLVTVESEYQQEIPIVLLLLIFTA